MAKAVKRNRLRRLMRECYRLSENRLKSGYDIILAARDGSLCVDTYEDASRIFDKLFVRAGLIAKEEAVPKSQNRDV